MLQRIEVSDLCLGMHASERCYSCSESPYWKRKQPPDKEQDSSGAVAIGITELLVDEAVRFTNASIVPTSLDEELVTAQKLCAQSKAAVVEMFSHARMGHAIELEHINELIEDISRSISRHPNAFISLVRLKSSDEYTYMHSVAVCALMIAVAYQLNFSDELIQRAGLAGLLHDVGKMAVPGSILNKPGKLTADEYEVVRKHPQLGADMLQASEQVCDLVMDVCLHHHEKIDGSGYPHQLAGEKISLFARMAAVCDVYDAITSDRSYNEGWDPAIAIQRMSEWDGHFDRRVFQAFVKSVGIYPVGSIVRLKSGSIGVVIEQHHCSLLTPQVKVFYSTVSNTYIAHKVIDISESVETDKIIERIPAQRYGFKNAEALWAGTHAKG